MSDAIKAKLRRAGIPSDVFGTTLAKENLMPLRAYINEMESSSNPLIVFLHSGNSRTEAYSPKLDMALYLMAKELVLTHHEVYCCHLVDIHTALFRESEEADRIKERLAEVEDGFVVVRGFFDLSVPFMTPYEVAYFSSWLIGCQQRDRGVILQAARPLMQCSDWWPMSLLGYMRTRSTLFEVPS